MPTDHGFRRLRMRRTGHPRMPVIGPLDRYGQRWERDSTYCPWRSPGRSIVQV